MRKRATVGLAVEIAALVALALSPFLVYAGFQAADGESAARWPAGTLLADVADGTLRGFTLAHVDGAQPLLVRWPAPAVLNVPRVGELRGESAWRIGGAPLLAEGVAGSLGIDVPFSASGRALLPGGVPDAFDTSSLESAQADELRDLLHSAGPPLDAPGRWTNVAGSRAFVTDWMLVKRYLRGLPIPDPTPTVDARATAKAAALKAIKVEVLNAGAPKGGATDAAAKLRKAGFTVTRVANFVGRPVKGILVYYKGKIDSGNLVARTLGVRKPAALPASFKTEARVLVLVGGK